MANGHGGTRTPANPAPVSGPGASSRRTDGGPSARPAASQYGEAQALAQISQGLESGGGSRGQQQQPQARPVDTSRVVPMEEESRHPERPVTDGASLGPGSSQLPGTAEDLARMRAHLKTLKFLASMPHASSATRQFVRQLEGQLTQDAGQ